MIGAEDGQDAVKDENVSALAKSAIEHTRNTSV